MIIFWVCIIFLLVSVLKGIFNGGSHLETALDILKKRYAVGEINKDEFELMKKDIQS
jgi:putative membrane protein